MFTGWSNLFDYHSKDSLEASCYLPIPRHTTWINVNDDEDIDITNMNLHNGASLVEHIEQIYDENGNVTNTSERNKLLGIFLREISLTNG
jgi:ribosome-associated toxin RatA of RatAB toxin-antitoxin module